MQQGIAAIPAKDRRLVVGEYLKHLTDTQAVIIKCAQEYQHKYLKRVEFGKLQLLQLSPTRQVIGCLRSGRGYLKGGRAQRS